MRNLISIVFLFTCIASEGQTFGQNLNISSLDKVQISEDNKTLLRTVFIFLLNLPIQDKYSQESIDSVKKGLNLFTLPQTDSLKKNISTVDALKLTESDEPLLHLLGFWILSQRDYSQKEITTTLKRIASIPRKGPQLTFFCLCEPYAFTYFKTAILIPTPYICFDMITHKYSVWSNCILVTGKYKRKANKIIRQFNVRMQSEMVTIH